MANSKTIKSAAPTKAPAAGPLGLSTLLLAAVVALELTGMQALPQGQDNPEMVAAIDGATINAPGRILRAAPVEVRIVAQADGLVR